MLKVGDVLYCYNNDIFEINLTLGNKYIVSGINFNDGLMCVKDDFNTYIYFTIEKDKNDDSYNNWFKTLKDYRKEKLNKLKI